MEKPSELGQLAVYYMAAHDDWDGFRSTYRKNPTIKTGGGIDIKFLQYIGDDREQSSDGWGGEYPNGSVGTHSLIFEVTGNGDEKTYVRKDGKCDSYGEETWDGPLYEVKIVTKSINAYERI